MSNVIAIARLVSEMAGYGKTDRDTHGLDSTLKVTNSLMTLQAKSASRVEATHNQNGKIQCKYFSTLCDLAMGHGHQNYYEHLQPDTDYYHAVPMMWLFKQHQRKCQHCFCRGRNDVSDLP